jgi:8-oxo-dGTP pyrophosphatase MutT (NUDIX family)
MKFVDFKNSISKLTKVALPATDAHLKMAPLERINFLKSFKHLESKPKEAAVLIMVYPDNEDAYIALIVRNSYPGVHSSQISFPGGKVETTDKNHEETALRETYEEVGVHPTEVEIIRAMSEIYIPPSNFTVSPYLGFCDYKPNFIPNPEEVKRMLEFPIDKLLDENTIVQTKMTTSYANNIDVPAFQLEKYVVWGATAMMLSELKDLLKEV